MAQVETLRRKIQQEFLERALVGASAQRITMTSRKGYDMTARYPELHALASAINKRVLLGGEIVCLDGDKGEPSRLARGRLETSGGPNGGQPAE